MNAAEILNGRRDTSWWQDNALSSARSALFLCFFEQVYPQNCAIQLFIKWRKIFSNPGLSPSGMCVPVQQHTQTDKDSSRCGYGYEVNLNLSQRGKKRRKKSGKAANKEDIEMTMCSLSKLCPNYILPKANFHPRFVSANWIPLLQNKCFFSSFHLSGILVL